MITKLCKNMSGTKLKARQALRDNEKTLPSDLQAQTMIYKRSSDFKTAAFSASGSPNYPIRKANN